MHYRQPLTVNASVLYHNLTGSFNNGWIYSGGKSIARISPSTKDQYLANKKILNLSLSRERAMASKDKVMLKQAVICYTTPVFNYGEVCVGPDGAQVCTPKLISVIYTEVCDGGGSDDEGGYIPPPTGSGGSGNTSLPTGTQINNFILSQNSQIKYPRFTTLLKELKSFVQNDKAVLDALLTYSGFSKSKILEKLEFGKGPEIIIKKLENQYGYFNKSESTTIINIDQDWVRGLEIANLLSTRQATAFLLGVTVLHEFVHQARAENNLDRAWEYGTGFENMAFGLEIDSDNAGNYSYRFYGK